MKRASALTTLILSFGVASPVLAQSVLINFETPTSFASINTHYAGGTDSAGLAGANLGVSFGADALAVQNDALGPYFSNAPSPLGVMSPVGPEAFMNVPVGFTDLSFFYSSNTAVAGAVKVWSGLNGTGTLLTSLSLANNAQSGCNDTAFCRFDALSTSWAGVARSVGFGDAAGVAGFDNVTITAVPEPTTSLLMALGLVGLAGLGMARRR